MSDENRECVRGHGWCPGPDMVKNNPQQFCAGCYCEVYSDG